jgi:hypothetical protein
MDRAPIGIGDKVRFRPKKLPLYSQTYGVTEDDVFVVKFVEPRHGKRALYLEGAGRESWLAAYPSALQLVQRAIPDDPA